MKIHFFKNIIAKCKVNFRKFSCFHSRRVKGLFLIIFGSVFFIFIFSFLYFNILRIHSFPEFIPAKEGAVYLEFPTKLEGDAVKKIEEVLQVHWEQEILPWAGEKAALVFLKPEAKEGELLPFFFIQIQSLEKAFAFLKTYKNSEQQVREIRVAGLKAFSTQTFHFAFLSDILVISRSLENLQTLLEGQSIFTNPLSREREFSHIRQQVNRPFFLYGKSAEFSPHILRYFEQYIPDIFSFTLPVSVFGVGVDQKENILDGNSYVFTENIPLFENEQSYRAALLPFLPPDFDGMLSGHNFPLQINKIDAFITNLKVRGSLPLLRDILTLVHEEYLPGISFEQDIAPFLKKEFALTIYGTKVLFIAELSKEVQEASLEKIRAAFEKIAGKFSPLIREVILPDGIKAQEFIPDISQVKSFHESFHDILIRGFLFGKKDGGVYDAAIQGKWFISNDLMTLQKALLLTKESGRNLRESDVYSMALQPILKNPELLGIAQFPHGIFSFSKQIKNTHIETNFRYVKNQ